MDTTLTTPQFIITDKLALDSISLKLTELQNLVDQSAPTSSYSIWIPFLSAIVGGTLVLAGQSIDRSKKRNQETENSLREIYAYCRKLEAIMKNNYRELAMAKFHVEYWWYCHVISDNSYKGRNYEEHLRSQTLAREIERKIGETKADYIGHVRKFQAIKAIKSDIEEQLLRISDLVNPKAKPYDTKIPYEKVRNEMAEQDEKELREKYYENLVDFKSINDYLQTLLKKSNGAK